MKEISKKIQRVYFDCNATTPILEAAGHAALCSMQTIFANPSSSHMQGAEAKIILERARNSAAEVLNASPSEIYFTSGATEAIQISVLSVLKKISLEDYRKRNKILVSAVEHKAVSNALEHWISMLNLNLEVITIGVNKLGELNFHEIEEHLEETSFICTMAVNNETGNITQLGKVEKIIRSSKKHIYWLADCVQALGKIDLNFSNLSVDYAAFSGHKLHAPKGIGFLYVKENAPKCPLIVGGGQERGIRSGTENLPGIAALGVVLEKLSSMKKGDQSSEFRTHLEMIKFREMLLEALKNSFPTIAINTNLENSIPTTIHFSIFGIASTELTRVFDAAGISVSGGSACNAKSLEPSHVLVAMGLESWRTTSGIRLSFGMTTTLEEIEFGIKSIYLSASALKKSCQNLSCYIEDYYNESLQKNDTTIHGLYQIKEENSNTWILVDNFTKSCLIVDPSKENITKTVNLIHCKNLKIEAIVDTHSHADHESCRKEILNLLNINDNALDNLGWNSLNDKLNFNSELWNIYKKEIPGHTMDSICLVVYEKNSNVNPKFAFIGDTILAAGIGRSDFGISGISSLYYSLIKLDTFLEENTLLCSSHDYINSFATTWGHEKRTNSLLEQIFSLNSISEKEFCEVKSKIDSELTSPDIHGKIMCGLIDLNSIYSKDNPVLSIDALCLDKYKIIDVREMAESLLFSHWESIGIQIQPENYPMSKIPNLFLEFLDKNNDYNNKNVILICSTGNRSLFIAKALRRIGFEKVWSLAGGVAFSLLKNEELSASV